jgi:hypothetical protein
LSSPLAGTGGVVEVVVDVDVADDVLEEGDASEE